MNITYAITDIHGRFDLLLKAFDEIMRDLNGNNGHIVFTGDYVDRGPQSREVVECLMKIQADPTSSVSFLKGNHEDMMLQALRTDRTPNIVRWWLENGGDATMKSYGDDVPAEHLDWMEGLPSVVEIADRLFVHAGFMPGFPLEEQEEDACMWIRERFLFAERDFETWPHIVHGHTPYHVAKQLDQPELLSWRTNLDTGAYHTGVLTVGVFEGKGTPATRTLRIEL